MRTLYLLATLAIFAVVFVGGHIIQNLTTKDMQCCAFRVYLNQTLPPAHYVTLVDKEGNFQGADIPQHGYNKTYWVRSCGPNYTAGIARENQPGEFERTPEYDGYIIKIQLCYVVSPFCNPNGTWLKFYFGSAPVTEKTCAGEYVPFGKTEEMCCVNWFKLST